MGERSRCVLLDHEILDPDYRIFSSDGDLYIPLIKEPSSIIFDQLPECAEVKEQYFEKLNKRPTLEDLLGYVPQYEVVGDIAIIESDPENEITVAEALIDVHPNIKTVIASIGPVEGEYRIRKYRIIKGRPTTETIHKEHGCRYFLDITKAYFTPRLSTERDRILSQISPRDVVVDMFAGIGPYSILIAKKSGAKKVVAIDKNPDAIVYLKKNVDLNRLDNVEVVESDAYDAADQYKNSADHVIMNLPHSAHEFLEPALRISKEGGIVHFYDIIHEDDMFEGSVRKIETACQRSNKCIQIKDLRIVRSYAPHQYNICIEFQVNGSQKSSA